MATRSITAHENPDEPFVLCDLRVGGSALIGWLSPYAASIPGYLLTYFYDEHLGRSSAASPDTRQVWVQSVEEAIRFLQEH